jgi:D-arabinose 1-dehydrogenase-like Zn-dependent alcohol dehydrogenase
MSTMKAARVTEFHAPYKVSSIDIPKQTADQLLVKTGAAGFCHTGNS